MIVNNKKSASSNGNDVVNVDNNNCIKQQMTAGSRQKISIYPLHSDIIISSSYLSYVTDDSNSNHLSFDDDDSIEESSLTAWIEKCIIGTSSCSSLSSNHHDEDTFDRSFLDDYENNIDELVDHMILACHVDSDPVIRSTDLQNSCRIPSRNREDIYSTTSCSSSRGNIESITNRINSRRNVYLKILRKETIPSPIENKHSISDDIFNDDYYGYI